MWNRTKALTGDLVEVRDEATKTCAFPAVFKTGSLLADDSLLGIHEEYTTGGPVEHVFPDDWITSKTRISQFVQKVRERLLENAGVINCNLPLAHEPTRGRLLNEPGIVYFDLVSTPTRYSASDEVGALARENKNLANRVLGLESELAQLRKLLPKLLETTSVRERVAKVGLSAARTNGIVHNPRAAWEIAIERDSSPSPMDNLEELYE